MELLLEYPFPGNVRELENIIERSVALETSNIILPENLHLSGNIQDFDQTINFELPDDGVNLNDELSKHEKLLIEKAITKANGSKTRAAELLHVSSDSLRYRIEKLGIN